MKSILVTILVLFYVFSVQAYDNHTYQIMSTLTQSTVRVDMDTKNLIVSDVEYPGWSEFFYMFADDDDPTTFTLANFAFREPMTLGVDCSAKDTPCHISESRTRFRLNDPADLGKPAPIINADNGYVWTVDDRDLPYGNIELKKPNGGAQQSFVLLRWE